MKKIFSLLFFLIGLFLTPFVVISQDNLFEKLPYTFDLKMFNAVKSQNFTDLKSSLEEGADIEYRDNRGRTALFYAISNYKKSSDIFDYLIDKGADVNAFDNNGITPLIWLIAKNKGRSKDIPQLEIMFQQLLKAGARIGVCDDKINNVLMTAILKNNIAVVDFLLSLDQALNLSKIANIYGQTPIILSILKKNEKIYDKLRKLGVKISLEDKMIAAVRFGQIEEMIQILNNKVDLQYNFVFDNGKTALFYALDKYNKDETFFNTLMKHKNIDVNVKDIDNNTPIIYALKVIKNDKKLLRVFNSFLKKKAVFTNQDYQGYTVFMYSVLAKRQKIIDWLLNRDQKCVLIEKEDYLGRTPLMIVAEQGNYLLYNILIKCGAKQKRVDYNGKTILMYAVKSKNIKNIKRILGAKVNINAQDNDGRTALMYAITKKSDNDLINVLLKSRAKTDYTDKYGKTVLMHALENKVSYDVFFQLVSQTKKYDIVDIKGKTVAMYAFQYGVEAKFITNIINKKFDINRADNYGRPALLYAIKNNNDRITYGFFNKFDNFSITDQTGEGLLLYALKNHKQSFIMFLLNKGLHAEKLNKKTKETFLMRATKKIKNYNSFLQYLNFFYNFNDQDYEGKTAMIYAVENNNFGALRALYLKGADINLQDNNGETALMYAIKLKNIRIINLLMNFSIDVNIANNEGKTALMYALQLGNSRMVSLLSKKILKWEKKNKDLQGAIHFAINGGNKSLIELAISKVDFKIDETDIYAKTLLMYAAEKGQTDLVSELLEEGADINLQEGAGRTALMYAGTANSLKTMEILLNTEGIDLTLVDKEGKVPLAYAVELKSWTLDRYWKGLRGWQLDEDGMNVLMHAVELGNTFLLRVFLKSRIKYDLIAKNGRTALMLAAMNRDILSMRVIMENYIGDVDEYFFDGSGRESFLRGKFPLSSADIHGRNLLMYMNNFYTPFKEYIHLTEDQFFKIEESRSDDYEWDNFIDDYKIFKTTLKNTYNKQKIWNEKDLSYKLKSTINPLIISSYLSNIIAKTKDINLADKEGVTALMHHSKNAPLVVYLQKFIDANADVKAIDKNGFTALHYAAKYNFSADVVAYLMKLIDPNLKDTFGRIALSYALEYNPNPSVALLLLQGQSLKKMDPVIKDYYIKFLTNNFYYRYFPLQNRKILKFFDLIKK